MSYSLRVLDSDRGRIGNGDKFAVLRNGRRTGHIIDTFYDRHDPTVLEVDYIGPRDWAVGERAPESRLGARGLLEVFRRLASFYPEAERLVGRRVSGASANTGAAGVDINLARLRKSAAPAGGTGSGWDESAHPRDDRGRWEDK